MSSTSRLASAAIPRPTFHFTPRRNWMNDPNGLVYHQGRWHLFFQYNPEELSWGNMSWGHASSGDLCHWVEHPVALRYQDGEQIFSGSIVSTADDRGNLLTAYYTSAYVDGRQAQSRATSRDAGITWELDPDNPVLDRGTTAFRDPKIIRITDEEAHARWVLLAVEADDRQVLFYSSEDLRTWQHESSFGPIGPSGVVWECPDLVPLCVDGDPADVRWVLLLSTNPVGDDADPDGSSMHYVVGDFDGSVFTPHTPGLSRLDHGRDLYAGVTFDSAPNADAIMIAWMSNWRYADVFPTTPWRGAMSLSRRLALCTVDGVPTLVQEPPAFVRELLAEATLTRMPPSGTRLQIGGHSLLELAWAPTATGVLRVTLRGTVDASVTIEHDPVTGVLQICRSGPAAHAVNPAFPSVSTVRLGHRHRMRLLLSLDGPLLEVFVGAGEATVSNLVLLGDGEITADFLADRDGPIEIVVADMSTIATAYTR